MCPHQQGTLALWCYCEAAEERFEKLLEKQNQKPTGALMEQNIDKCEKQSYLVSVSPSKKDGPFTQREISHLEMLKYVGVRQLGESVQEEFGCKCAEGNENPESHCRRHQQIFINVKEESTGKIIPYSKNLRCDSGRHEEQEKQTPLVEQQRTTEEQRVTEQENIHRDSRTFQPQPVGQQQRTTELDYILQRLMIEPHRGRGMILLIS